MGEHDPVNVGDALAAGVLESVRIKGSRSTHLIRPNSTLTICNRVHIPQYGVNKHHRTCTTCVTFWTVDYNGCRTESVTVIPSNE